MIITNKLDRVNFSDIPATMPSIWDLSGFLPSGVLGAEHLYVRFRRQGAYWTVWGHPDAWDQATKVATFFRSGVITEVEFRRKTPRFAPYLDPILKTARVSENSLRVNADQGAMVAQEWAGELGINALSDMRSGSAGVNELGLIQLTQNHYDLTGGFTGRKVWDFAFAGGYIDRSHVRAQVLTDAGWIQLDISEEDENEDAPYRFIGPFTLHLDLSGLTNPTRLVIYRHTPRFNVAHPSDGDRITAVSMEPSARQAFFVAVEVGEELGRVATPCECKVFYTSGLYPELVEEDLSIATPGFSGNGLLYSYGVDVVSYGVPGIQAGTLSSTINYVFYNEYEHEVLSLGTPSVTEGSLVVAIVYKSYTSLWEELWTPVPDILSGSLVVAIVHVNYTNALPENIGMAVPAITDGTLT